MSTVHSVSVPRGDSPVFPQAVIFDWDNTLIDSWPVLHEALNGTLRAFGHAPWTFDETRRRVARSLRDSFPELFKARWEEARDDFYARFQAIHLDRLTPLPGAEILLNAFRDNGVYLAVVSNKKGPILRREAAHLGWTDHFAHIVGADDCPRDKPAPDPVLRALDGVTRERGAVWFVGDSPIDMECAAGSACVGVLLRPEAPAAGEFRYPPALHFGDCRDLGGFVKARPSR